MRKSIIYLVVALTLLILPLAFVPHALAQQDSGNSSIKVLNYSYQIDYNHNVIFLYGEVQNVGSSTLKDVSIGGSIYSDSIDQSDSTGKAYAIYIVPQQKVPFEIDFRAPTSSSDGNWDAVSISKIDFIVTESTVTTDYPYSDVKITSQSSSIDTTSAAKGTYWVSGNIQNTGGQDAQDIYIVATFYNSSGDTVSAGWSTMIENLNSKASTSFKVGAFDINMSGKNPRQQITSYSLLVRPGTPILNGTAPDPSEYGLVAKSSTSQSSSLSNPTSNGSSTSNGSFNTEWLIYAAIIIIIIIAVIVTVRSLPKRKPTGKTKINQKASSKKPTR